MTEYTREQILAMGAGRELDALVAEKVFGHTQLNVEEMKSIAEKQWEIQPECRYFTRGFEAWMEDGEFRWQYNGKSYSTDISAAWEVVEKVNKTQKVEMWHEPENDDFDPFTIRINNITVGSESAPEAICKAALLAVMNL